LVLSIDESLIFVAVILRLKNIPKVYEFLLLNPNSIFIFCGMAENPETISPKSHIIIEGARVHNLKNISVSIPRNSFTVITGLSGSGKSSLAFDTLYAEGQRRFVESLSSYARQFLGRLDKPDVDNIRGISPAIAIEQKVISTNPRSTLGSITEISSLLRLMYTRIGITYSPVSGKAVKRHSVSDVLDSVKNLSEGHKFMVLAPIKIPGGRKTSDYFETLIRQGYSRILNDGEVAELSELKSADVRLNKNTFLIIDRLSNRPNDDDFVSRFGDSVETAFAEGRGECVIFFPDGNEYLSFSDRFEADGIVFEVPSDHFFSPNNPVGACKTCGGYGMVIGIDENLVIPDKSLSVYNNAIACWRGEQSGEWRDMLLRKAHLFDFPIHKPVKDLTAGQYQLLWSGNKHFGGINEFFAFVEQQTYKIQYRVLLSRFRGRTKCNDCGGSRLRKDAAYVKVGGKSITDLSAMSVDNLWSFFSNLILCAHETKIAGRVVVEIQSRLRFLKEVGLGYLSIDRQAMTLSGGESQRINLATSLGSSLVGSMYVLDEPSIGLHPRDTTRLISVLKALQKQGNTVIVVEHDEEIMRSADYIIDMGPRAGSLGGQVVFNGHFDDLLKKGNGLTADYLSGRMSVGKPEMARKSNDRLILKGARSNNLKNIDVEFPLRILTAVTGVSGSGKSTLIREVLYPALLRAMGKPGPTPGQFDILSGDIKSINAVEMVDQNPIGRSSRSNALTYLNAFDLIRELMATCPSGKALNMRPGLFSFNVPGGRCETCQGEGVMTVEMQFMANVQYQCEDCKGKRFKQEVLAVMYNGKNIADLLELTVDDAIAFFKDDLISKPDSRIKSLLKTLETLCDVGMGYIKLGQSSDTFSGGEAQRIKLAHFLNTNQKGHTVFIFDEPTTGLHFHDIQLLLKSLNGLVSQGHTVILIEHHPDVIQSADWIVDLGPDSGPNGGEVVFTGTPDQLRKSTNSTTGRFLKV
jgi:excinuclease ABC subunit A